MSRRIRSEVDQEVDFEKRLKRDSGERGSELEKENLLRKGRREVGIGQESVRKEIGTRTREGWAAFSRMLR